MSWLSKAWSTATDAVRGVAHVATEVLEVTGDVVSGRIADIPGDVIDVGQAIAEETGLGDYIAAQAGSSVITNATGSTAHTTVGMNGSGNGGAMAVNGATTAGVVRRGCYQQVVDPNTGAVVWQKCKRRRRRRLLTASDKADLAFIIGQLGQGQTGKAAVSALLSRRV